MSKLIIDALSDTHNRHKEFTCEGGDILLHSGDCTGRGTLAEALDFLDWYGAQPYTHKVLIAGNHDWVFEREPALMADECKKRGIIYLNDSGVILKDTMGQKGDYLIRVWGSPVQPWFYDWAFNRRRTLEEATAFGGGWIKNHWDLIPNNTEILLTHGPAMGYGDGVERFGRDAEFTTEHVGCAELLHAIQQSEIKLHISGHIHEGRGFYYEKDTTFVNASSLNRMYYPVTKKPMRITREIFQDGSVGYVL